MTIGKSKKAAGVKRRTPSDRVRLVLTYHAGRPRLQATEILRISERTARNVLRGRRPVHFEFLRPAVAGGQPLLRLPSISMTFLAELFAWAMMAVLASEMICSFEKRAISDAMSTSSTCERAEA